MNNHKMTNSSAIQMVMKGDGLISSVHECTTEESTHLCIFNFAHKLQNDNTVYDIGGTYTETKPDLWFYCTTSECQGKNYLLNLFVLTRTPQIFSISLPETNITQYITKHKDFNILYLKYNSFEEQTLQTTSEDEYKYLKTYNFTQDQLNSYGNASLFIPLKITVHSLLKLSNHVVNSIKYTHNTKGVLSRNVNTDFTITSASKTKFAVHKVVLAASSPVLRNLIKSGDNSIFLDIEDENIEILLGFLYNGNVEDIENKNCITLFNLAEKFQLKKLSELTQATLTKQINVDNVVNIAILAKEHMLSDLSLIAFSFIKEHPEVLRTEAWNKLEDTELVKSLLQYIHLP